MIQKFKLFLKETSYVKIIITYIIFLFVGFLTLLKNPKSENLNFISDKVMNQLKSENNEDLEEKMAEKFAKKVYIEEAFRRLIDSKIRKSTFALNDDEKTFLVNHLNAKKAKQENENPNSFLVKEIEYEIDVVNKGYNPINFTMEYLLNLNTNEFLKNQTKYFFIFLISLVFIITLFLKRLNNVKQ